MCSPWEPVFEQTERQDVLVDKTEPSIIAAAARLNKNNKQRQCCRRPPARPPARLTLVVGLLVVPATHRRSTQVHIRRAKHENLRGTPHVAIAGRAMRAAETVPSQTGCANTTAS